MGGMITEKEARCKGQEGREGREGKEGDKETGRREGRRQEARGKKQDAEGRIQEAGKLEWRGI